MTEGIQVRVEEAECALNVRFLKSYAASLIIRAHWGGQWHRKIHPKAAGASYPSIEVQNHYLLKTVFDGTGNYIYHRDSIRATFDVGSARLACLRKLVQEARSRPFVEKSRVEVTHYSDVVLPKGCELPASTWLQQQPEQARVMCRNTKRHSNAEKRSHNAKDEGILNRFFMFVDLKSSPNGHKERSHGSTCYFHPNLQWCEHLIRIHSTFTNAATVCFLSLIAR